MALAQGPNGVIYLFGSKMGCVAFNESWLRAARAAHHGRTTMPLGPLYQE